MSRFLEELPSEEREMFETDALYVVPTWKDAKPILKQYLLQLNVPIISIGCNKKSSHINHIDRDINLPQINAFGVGAQIMLLCNYIVEIGLFNGAIGTIVDIVYPVSNGPHTDALLLYIVVNFVNISIPLQCAYDGSNPNHVPFSVKTMRCESSCCEMTTTPLHVCKAISFTSVKEWQLDCRKCFQKLLPCCPVKSQEWTDLVSTWWLSQESKNLMTLLSFQMIQIHLPTNPLGLLVSQNHSTTEKYSNKKCFFNVMKFQRKKFKKLSKHTPQRKHQQYRMVTTTVFNGTEELVTIRFENILRAYKLFFFPFLLFPFLAAQFVHV